MYSTLTERSAAATLEALARGAADYVTKPTGAVNQDAATASIRRDLVPMMRTWGRIERGATLPGNGCSGCGINTSEDVTGSARLVGFDRGHGPRHTSGFMRCSSDHRPVGPKALTEVISSLPASLPVPVLVVQHMPEVFTKLLAERLDARCVSPVVEVQDGDVISPGTTYIAQGGSHFAVRRAGAHVLADCAERPPENHCRPAVDVLFRSAVEVWGAGLLAVMLTGMGTDGLRGSRRIIEAGGTVLAQDEAT